MSETAENYTYWQNNGQFWAGEYERRRTTTARYGLQEIVLATIIDANTPARVFEFGCGVGRHLSYLTKIPGADVYGGDQSPTMLAGVPLAGDPAMAGRTLLIEPTGRLPLDDGEFDIVFSAEVLIHVRPEDLDGRLAELVRVCRGSLLHLEPHADYPLAAAEHDGCWYHDLVAAYARLGLVARRAGRPLEAQELVVVDLDQSRPLHVPGATVLRHILAVESCIQMGIDRVVAPAAAAGQSIEPLAEPVEDELSILFPTQSTPKPFVIPDEDRAIGAPFWPVPRSLIADDPRLGPCQRLPTTDELDRIVSLRSAFRVGDYPDPYVTDVARAFRLLEGKGTYLEVGTFDRGNLAYMASIMADDALLIGLDIQDEPSRDALLLSKLKPGQNYVPVVGSSRSPISVEKVRDSLGGRKLDGIFIDGDHTAYGTLSDFANFEDMVADDGIIMVHDSAWEGDAQYKGVVDALDEIARKDLVYLIDGQNPVREFSRPMWREEMWGVVGLVFANDQKWRKLKD